MTELETTKQEIARVYRPYQDGQLDSGGFGKFYQPLEERRKQLEANIPRVQAEIDLCGVSNLSAAEIASKAQNFDQMWPQLEPDEKRGLVEAMTEKIVVGKDQTNITLCYLPPCEELAKTWRKGRDSNPRLGYPNA